MRTFMFRCFIAFALMLTLVLGSIAVCVIMALGKPGFYSKALAEPLSQEEIDVAIRELEEMTQTMESFIVAGKLDPQELQLVRQLATKPANLNQPLPVKLDDLDRALKMSYDVTLTQQQLNAWLATEMGSCGGDLKQPHIALEGDKVRFAVGLDTPFKEIVLSCDFKLSKTNGTDLALELHSVKCGNLPLPAATILKQVMRAKPKLPSGVTLDVSGDRPRLTFAALPETGAIQIKQLTFQNGQAHLIVGLAGRDKHGKR